MLKYDLLIDEATEEGLHIKEFPLCHNDGRLYDNRIAIRSDLSTTEKTCVLAEELGHYYTSVGDILDQSKPYNRKQERQARLWAYNCLIGLDGIIRAYKAGCSDIHDTAEYLNVTEEFLYECVECYRNKYGIYTKHNGFYIYFEPYLTVSKELV